MEDGAFEMQRLAGWASAFLACAKRTEVFCGFRHNVVPQLHGDSASSSTANSHIEKDFHWHFCTGVLMMMISRRKMALGFWKKKKGL